APESKEAASDRISRIERVLTEYNEGVAKKQADLDRMKEEFKIVRAEDDPSNYINESLRKLESARIETMSSFAQINALSEQLKGLTRTDLKKAILTASPDPILTLLMENQSAAEQKLAVASE